MKIAALLFVLMFVNYGLNAMSIRYVARGSYLGVAITDFLIAGFGFTMLKQIVDANTWPQLLAYAAGGVFGSMLGFWLTRHTSPEDPAK